MSIRIVYPIVNSNGIANNINALAKAYLISRSCEMVYQSPVWPFCPHVKPSTPNGYGYYFPSSLIDKLKLHIFSYQYRIQSKFSVQLFPVLRFTYEDYNQTMIEDVGEACQKYLKSLGLDNPSKSVVLSTYGMWPGYKEIQRARPWILNLLLTHSNTRKRLIEIEQHKSGRMLIGVNIRLGDFQPPKTSGKIREGERNVRLPLNWYIRICRLIQQTCINCEFVLVSDGTRKELSPFLEEFDPIHMIDDPFNDILGLLLLSGSDLVICSNSTYSRLGVFLNDNPYIWCADSLVRDTQGQFGYLHKNHIAKNPIPNSDRSDLDAVRRCFALSINVTNLPDGLTRYLTSNGKLSIEIPDDLLHCDPVYLM